MLNSDGIENGKKNKNNNNNNTDTNTNNNRSNQQKNNFARENTFLYISLPMLFHDYNVKLSSYMFSLSFSLPLVFTLLAANISHFLTTTIIILL